MRENRMSGSMRGRRKRATAQRACALLYRSPWLVSTNDEIRSLFLQFGRIQQPLSIGRPHWIAKAQNPRLQTSPAPAVCRRCCRAKVPNSLSGSIRTRASCRRETRWESGPVAWMGTFLAASHRSSQANQLRFDDAQLPVCRGERECAPPTHGYTADDVMASSAFHSHWLRSWRKLHPIQSHVAWDAGTKHQLLPVRHPGHAYIGLS